jgi:Flp pilus assembly protein TadD
MKKYLLILAAWMITALPAIAMAESPMSLPLDSDPLAYANNEDGITKFIKANYEVALEQFQAAKNIQNTAEINFNLALCLAKLGQSKEAKAYFEEARVLADGNERILTSSVLKSHLLQ